MKSDRVVELTGGQWLGGRPSSLGSDFFQAMNPATGEELGPDFREATAQEVDQALESAEAAFVEYRRLPKDRRIEFLEAVGEEILNLGDALIHRASAETSLPEARLAAERGRTVQQFRMFAELLREGSWVEARIDTAQPDRRPMPKPDVRRYLIPMGPVAVFGASNFPFAYSVAGGDTASALAAGNPVVVKGHPSHAGTSELVAQAVMAAVRRCRMPEGVFSLVQGRTNQVGLHLVEHPATCAVGFTGSLRGGRALFDAACRREVPIPVYAEMGSVNPVFVLPSAMKADPGGIAEGYQDSLTLGVGQFCTNPGLVVGCEGGDLERFQEHLDELISESAPGTMLSPEIRQAFEKGRMALGETAGVSVLAASRLSGDSSRNEESAVLFRTSGSTFLNQSQLSHEVFGPAGLLIACSSPDEMLEIARRLEGQLTATIHATPEDLMNHAELVDVLRQKVGRLIFNGFPTGVEVCPSMNHGGPYPATTDLRTTSVGTAAILRFVRPVCFQNFPEEALPEELRNRNALKIWRLIDGRWTQEDVPPPPRI